MNKQKLIEWGKTLLIIVLAISAIGLSGLWGLTDYLFANNPPANGSGDAGETVQTKAGRAAQPLSIMITTADNAHHGVKYNGEALDEAFLWFTASVGEALGSSGEPQEVTAGQWERALHGSGVFFDYLYEQSISSLARWLGVEISSDVILHTSRRFCLAIENDSVALYYIRAVDGKAYRCETALNSQRFYERMTEYVPNGAMFVFESGEQYDTLESYYTILPELATLNNLVASNPLQTSEGSQLLSIFGMNNYVATHYLEADGTNVYVEGEKSLRLSVNGSLLYNSLDSEDNNKLLVGTSDVIDIAYSLATSIVELESGNLQMSHISYDQNTDKYIVKFEYVCDGVVVCYGGRSSAMEIMINGAGELVRADILCRNYTAQEEITPMPERQALAVITELGGGEPMLAYTDDGENVELGWVIKR